MRATEKVWKRFCGKALSPGQETGGVPGQHGGPVGRQLQGRGGSWEGQPGVEAVRTACTATPTTELQAFSERRQ